MNMKIQKKKKKEKKKNQGWGAGVGAEAGQSRVFLAPWSWSRLKKLAGWKIKSIRK